MGKPAARARIDSSAHTGPIQSGSPNVIIGGFPAARKGDPLSCSQHGQGSILSGSTTVFVNGLPLAREGDKTGCNTSATPAVATTQPAPPQYWGGTAAKGAGKDGAIHGDVYDARVLGAYASLEDKSGFGKPDTASAGFALADITVGNTKSQDKYKDEVRTKVGVANASGTLVTDRADYGAINLNANATAIQYGASGSIGKEGEQYGGVGGDVYLATAEAKAVSEMYDGNKGRYGFNVELGAEAAAVKGEATAKADFYGVVVADGKLSGSAGSAGASAGVGTWIDSTDYSFNLKVSGELAVALGLGGDASIKLALKPILDWIYDDDESKPSPAAGSGDGVIKTGCVTVLVGD